MSDATDTSMDFDALTRTRQPFDLDDEMIAKVKELGLEDTVRHLKEEGYGYIHDVVDDAFNARLRETILRLCAADPSQQGGGANTLLDKDPIIVDVVLNPKLLAIVEVMCGKGAMISQLVGSVKKKGGPALPLHADQNWTPAPFPVHNQLVTFCWATDEFNEANGSTKVVPKAHLERRHPTVKEMQEEPGAIATECPAGSVVIWDGSIWHGSYPRSTEGERVVLHTTYSRLALRPIECYDHLDEEWLKDKPYEMRVLLGREDFLNTKEGAFAAGTQPLIRTMTWAKT